MHCKTITRLAAGLLASVAMTQSAAAASTSDLEAMIAAQQAQLAAQQQMLENMQLELKSLRKETSSKTEKAASAPALAPPQQSRAATVSQQGQAGESQYFKPAPESYYDQIGNFYATPVADLDPATDEYVRAGGRPKAWRIPGTGLDLSIGGYAKADFIASIDGETTGAEDVFSVPGIQSNGVIGTDDRVRFHARESRVNFDITGDSSYGLIRAFIEGDFFGAAGNEVLTNSDSFRLRHGFVQVGGLLAGQTWTTFMDVSALPNTLDFQGPGAESFIRQGQVRYTFDAGDGLTLAVAAENPESRVQVSGTGAVSSVRDTLPDFIARLKYEQSFGHLQIAALVRNSDAPAGFSDEVGFAVAGSGKINLPFLGERDNFKFQTIYADGASRYILDAALTSGDIATGAPGQSGTVEVFSVYGALQHYWADNLRSTVVGSYVDISRPSFFNGPNAISETLYVTGNLIWSPVSNVDLGVELQYGEVQRESGARGDATRIQSSAIFRF